MCGADTDTEDLRMSISSDLSQYLIYNINHCQMFQRF